MNVLIRMVMTLEQNTDTDVEIEEDGVVILPKWNETKIQADIVKKFRFFWGTVYEKLIGS